jgi:predicted membrane protein
MKTAIAKPLSVVIIIISFIVVFFSRNEMADTISAFMFLVGTIMLLATTVIDTMKGGGE